MTSQTSEPRDGSQPQEETVTETTTSGVIATAVDEASDPDGVVSLSNICATLGIRLPPSAIAAAEKDGKLTTSEKLGDVEAERRTALRTARARLWAETLRDWPDDDFTGARLDDIEPSRHLSAIIAWLADPEGQILILLGPTGRGKTYCAFAVGNAAAEGGDYVVAYSHKRYLDALEPDGSDVPDWQTRRRGANADLLIVDDLGTEMDPTQPASEFRTRETCDLLSSRMRRGKRTIITTNLRSDQLAVMFGDRIISRLRRGSTAVAVQGLDRRRAANW